MINDSHCHFFSHRLFEALARQAGGSGSDTVAWVTGKLGWERPGTPEDLADRWVAELDRHHVTRAALIASMPGDEESVSRAVGRHPTRFVGFFMVDPTGADAEVRVRRALTELGLRTVCLYPAMHHCSLHDVRTTRIFEVVAETRGAAVFVHCGALSVGVRKKLGLPSRFDMGLANPLDLHVIALDFPQVPIIIPHFGAGLFREALMVADLCPNVYLDTSSSNAWTKYHPGLTLTDVFRHALEVVGGDRLLFGTDSSFFPRGWQRSVWEDQKGALDRLDVDASIADRVFHANFNRLFT